MNPKEKVTAKILEALDQEIVPWKMSWTLQRPYNLVSWKPYRGINFLMLIIENRSQSAWLTFDQVKAKWGFVKKKAKSRPIIFWKIIEPKEEGKRPFPLIRYSNVYNIEDTTLVGLGENWKDNYSIEEIDAVINNYLTKNSIGLVKRDPCYIQSKNQIGMPNIRDFDSTGDYYHAYFHEIILSVIYWLMEISHIQR